MKTLEGANALGTKSIGDTLRGIALCPRRRRLGDMIEWHWLNVEEWHDLACHSFVSPAPFVPPEERAMGIHYEKKHCIPRPRHFVHHHPHPTLRATLPPQGGGNQPASTHYMQIYFLRKIC